MSVSVCVCLCVCVSVYECLYVSVCVSSFKRVDLQPFECWDRGFESRCGHGYSSVVFVVCYVGSGLCEGLITRLEKPYRL